MCREVEAVEREQDEGDKPLDEFADLASAWLVGGHPVVVLRHDVVQLRCTIALMQMMDLLLTNCVVLLVL